MQKFAASLNDDKSLPFDKKIGHFSFHYFHMEDAHPPPPAHPDWAI